jgi:hypothetical protein
MRAHEDCKKTKKHPARKEGNGLLIRAIGQREPLGVFDCSGGMRMVFFFPR